MKNLNIKQKISNDKGITLVALIVTITIVLIIAGISINTGTESLDDTRLKGFYAQLEFVQKRVDDIANTNEVYYIVNNDGTKTPLYLKTEGGSALKDTQKTALQEIITKQNINIPTGKLIEEFISEFRYFTVEDILEQLDLKEIDYNVFVHFDTRTIVAENGITINGVEYNILKNNIYYVEPNITDETSSMKLTYAPPTQYGTNNYKITVSPTGANGEVLTNGTLKYKKTSTKYWETTNNLEIVINELTQYNIEYINNNNVISQTITVSLDDDGNPTVTVAE